MSSLTNSLVDTYSGAVRFYMEMFSPQEVETALSQQKMIQAFYVFATARQDNGNYNLKTPPKCNDCADILLEGE